MPYTNLTRILLVIAGLVGVVLIGSLFALTGASFTSSPEEIAVTTPTTVLPTHTTVTTPTTAGLPTRATVTTSTTGLATRTSEAAITICQPDDQASACQPVKLGSSQDLADPGNSVARVAVSKDAQPAQPAKYGNDGHADTSWVSNSANSWIKLDLGQFRTINMVRLEKGNSAQGNELGSFVIAVTLSDVYADGDSKNDDREYIKVFDSKQAGFSGSVSDTPTINILFSPVQARFVKITFEKAGAAIAEVGVFMVEAPGLAGQPTITIPNTGFSTRTSTSKPDDQPANTPAPLQTPISTPRPSNTPIVLPTNTQPPADTETPSYP